MGRARRSKTGGVEASCPVCGGSVRADRSSTLALATALVLAGSVLSFYLIGLPLLAVGIGMAMRRERCVCAPA